MCSRYKAAADAAVLARRFGVAAAPGLTPRYNLAAGQAGAVVLAAPAPRMALLRFGLLPGWARAGEPQVNARAESLADKPFFRDAFRWRRCLVAADGWYERPRRGADKSPRLFKRRDGALFAFAGLWEPGGFAVVTTAPNPLVASVHDRMPAVLAADDEKAWLDAGTAPERLREMLRPYPSDLLEARPVSARLDSGADDPALLEPEPQAQCELFR